jgi:hypothetical protein
MNDQSHILMSLSYTLDDPRVPEEMRKAADTITRLIAGVEGLKRQIAEWVDAGGEAHSVIQRQMEDRAKLRAALQWQPIETAPKDGTPILAREKGAGPAVYMMCTMWSGSELEGWRIPGARGWTNARWFHPTHWMHLPPPPALKENSDDQG